MRDPLRAFADTLRTVHSNDYDYAANQTERNEGRVAPEPVIPELASPP